jgi:hypothetical protein
VFRFRGDRFTTQTSQSPSVPIDNNTTAKFGESCPIEYLRFRQGLPGRGLAVQPGAADRNPGRLQEGVSSIQKIVNMIVRMTMALEETTHYIILSVVQMSY